jgi:hypothetical protein
MHSWLRDNTELFHGAQSLQKKRSCRSMSDDVSVLWQQQSPVFPYPKVLLNSANPFAASVDDLQTLYTSIWAFTTQYLSQL